MKTKRRIACAQIPNYSIAVYCRENSRLKTQPLAVLGIGGEREGIRELSEVAIKSGIREGMTSVQARGVCPSAIILPQNQELLFLSGAEISKTLLSISPSVETENAGSGLFFLDTRGLLRQNDGHEENLLTKLKDVFRQQGYKVGLGLADRRFTAFAAAVCEKDQVVVKTGGDRRFLAPLPLCVLPLEEEMASSLATLGLTTLGDLAKLPVSSIERRFGEPGVLLHRIARGLDGNLLTLPKEEEDNSERIDFTSGGVTRFHELRKLLQSKLVKRLSELSRSGRGCEELRVVLSLDDGKERELIIRPAQSTGDVQSLLSLVELELFSSLQKKSTEEKTLSAPVIEVLLQVTRSAPLCENQGLLVVSRSASASRVGRVLHRLSQKYGREAVGTPSQGDSPLPEERFHMELASAMSVMNPPSTGNEGGIPERMLTAVNRIVHPPWRLQGGKGEREPRSFKWGGIVHRVSQCLGPFRASGRWWREPYTRDYYELLTQEGGVYRVFCDLRDGSWYLCGVVD